ncbi:YgaP family membrane protein [Frigidibacter sp. ROC022]|uniref:YgaP family membrane protein n=1 Tax=Frigidibacter sp. ROC022 TaxID=2971796 RepID=UPI00215B02EC|nr:DUF2892 domain-containing protein [Frigidibacter sp. ROC022]MCR8725479.1 DUF2892 domain-containing protein [Frigidibacter sp. ROC022]
MFKINEGSTDRILRVLVGLVMLGLYFFGPAWSMSWLLLIGVVPLLTGLLGTCPLYSLMGISTCPMKKN